MRPIDHESTDSLVPPVSPASDRNTSQASAAGGEETSVTVHDQNAGGVEAIAGSPAAPAQEGEGGPRGEEPDRSDTNGEGRRRRRNRRRGRRAGQPRDDDGADTGQLAIPETEGGAADPVADSVSSAEPLPAPGDASEWFAEVVSGTFDAQVEPPAAVDSGPARRILRPEPDAPKLQKVLAQTGVGSRRDLEQMIVDGRVTVNGQPAHTGQRVSWGDRVALDGKPIKIRIAPPPPRVIAYHKPVGEVVTHDDPQQRPTVFRKLPRLPRGKWQSVGRLDINTEGLLLFTNSGDLANRLMHPRFGVEREYAVRVLGLLSDEARERLLGGIEIDGQPAAFRSIEDGGGEGANHWYRVVITEGRHREVRRLFEAVGHAVSRLIRIRYGAMVLPRGLRRGMWVDLAPADIRLLQQATMPSDESRGPPSDRKVGRRGGRRGRGERRPGEGPEVFRGPAADAIEDDDGDAVGPIPNPLQQTYDKRAIQQARRLREIDEDGPIPNPLQQTYDKRAVQSERRLRQDLDEDGPIPNPLQQTYDKRFVQGGPGGGFPGSNGRPRRKPGGPKGPGAPKGPRGPKGPGGAGGPRAAGAAKAPPGQPDPMRTSVGYIGADAFLNKAKGRGGKGGRRR